MDGHEVDAGGNCRRPGCGFNIDAAYFAAVERGEDVYGDIPEPIDLPGPSGHDEDGTPWWRLASGERVYVWGRSVYTPAGEQSLEVAEGDALAVLAAVRAARGEWVA